MAFVSFIQLPNKAQVSIFGYLNQVERQKCCTVCTYWFKLIREEFPIYIDITNENLEVMLRCANASKITVKNLTNEIETKVTFGKIVHEIHFVGKIVTTNVLTLLRNCTNLEHLAFSSLNQAVSIESNECLNLPKVTTLEIKVKGDQDSFTMDEIIVIDLLKRLNFGCLERININVRSPLENWEEDMKELEFNFSRYSSTTESFEPSLGAINLTADPESGQITHFVSEALINTQAKSSRFEVEERRETVEVESTLNSAEDSLSPSEANTTRNDTIPSSVSTDIDNEGDDIEANDSSNFSPVNRLDDSERSSRNFVANLQFLVETEELDEVDPLNESNRMPQDSFINSPSLIKHTVFFDFLLKNNDSLKKLIVTASSDFTCLGNIANHYTDCGNIQFEEVEYSFGRSVIYMEYVLLRVQNKLRRIRAHILDDLWVHLLSAIKSSCNTINEVDIQLLCLNDDPLSLTGFSKCTTLQKLKLLYLYEKTNLNLLPTSLEKLFLNGPLKTEDLKSIAERLTNLTDFSLLLNSRGGKIDLELFNMFLRLPKLKSLIFVQCALDVEGISKKCKLTAGLEMMIDGPQQLQEVPNIQYVVIHVKPDFQREQV